MKGEKEEENEEYNLFSIKKETRRCSLLLSTLLVANVMLYIRPSYLLLQYEQLILDFEYFFQLNFEQIS